MVGAVGLTESAKGDLKAEARAARHQPDHRPGRAARSARRTRRSPTTRCTASKAVSTVTARGRDDRTSRASIALPTEGGSDYYQAFPVPVRAADLDLPAVLDVPMVDGRWLSDVRQQAAHARRSVLGAGLAKQYAYLPRRDRTIRLNDTDFGVVGVLGPVALDPDLDNAVFITQWAAKHDFATDGKPNQLYVRVDPGRRRRRRPTRSRPRSTSAAPTRCRRRCRATCCRRRRRPTRRCSRPRCSRVCSR